MIEIYDFKVENRIMPIGIDKPAPVFSWKFHSDHNCVIQNRYRLVVSSSGKILWDSGTVCSSKSCYILYEGIPLQAGRQYLAKLCIIDNFGEKAIADTGFETGLMEESNWVANWITHSGEEDQEPCAVFHKTFETENRVKKARLYMSTLGIYSVKLNGDLFSDIRFAPGWTNYRARIQYQTYDITKYIQKENLLEVTVANGWYKGILGFEQKGNHYGTKTALIAQLEIEYEDGRKERICSDESWTCTTGEIRYADIYNGQMVDKTVAKEAELPVQILDYSKAVLIAQEDEPVRIIERIPAKKLLITPKGEVVIDFGQNLTGVCEIQLQEETGTKVIIRHAEALDENGCFYTENLRTAKATDVFICSGKKDVFCPEFTYHGFRYIQVEGVGQNPDINNFTACVIHTDLERTGIFCCGNEDIQKLWNNIDWTMRSNYLELPTDCPQRDERFGYTGDAQIFLPTAAFHRNVLSFYKKWLRDLKTEQSMECGVPMAVPNILGNSGAIAVWHEAAAIVPWTLWMVYGDKQILEEQYESIQACVDYTTGTTAEDGLIHDTYQLGDWVALDMERGPLRKPRKGVLNLPPDQKRGSTDVYLIANAFYLKSIEIMHQTAEVLGRDEDAKKYLALYESVLSSFQNEYFTPAGRLVSETQTGCAIVLQFHLCKDKDRGRITEILKNNLIRHQNHLTTGFAGTQFLCEALSDQGEHETAGEVLLKEDCPSWLYSVKLGATTVWELWDGVNEDGSFNPYEMNSLNQYAFASIGNWMYTRLGGIQMLEPGYKKSRIAPRLVKGIPEVRTSLETIYGRLSCEIWCKKRKYVVQLEIPENTTCCVCLPEREELLLGSGHYHFEYETASVFEKGRYSRDTIFGTIFADKSAKQMLQTYAGELLENAMFLSFAMEKSITELQTMLPPEAMDLFDRIIERLNEKECEADLKS